MPDVGITFAILALGFALGYGVREQMSRKRHRRARERGRLLKRPINNATGRRCLRIFDFYPRSPWTHK
jgi:hypothetical protein